MIYTREFLQVWIETRGFEIGEHTYGYPEILSWSPETSRLLIGRYCSLATGVQIFMGGNHRPDWVTTYPFPGLPAAWPGAELIEGHPGSGGDVRIGNDVWIGQQATVMSGVTIDDGAVVAAHSLVVKDVPPYAVVGGNPARLLRFRFTDEIIARLLRLQWWNWPDDQVREAIPLLCSPDLTAFLTKYETAGSDG